MAVNPQIQKYSDEVNALFDNLGKSVDEIVTGIDGVSKDVTFLKDTITKLQNNPGVLSAEDQALLDAAESRVGALATKTASVSAAVKALDEATASEEVPTPPSP